MERYEFGCNQICLWSWDFGKLSGFLSDFCLSIDSEDINYDRCCALINQS